MVSIRWEKLFEVRSDENETAAAVS